jgi:transcriptional regulator with XRE-family HTH domain
MTSSDEFAEFKERFARRVTHMRERRGLDVRELAKKAGTSYQTIWRIEQKHVEAGSYLAMCLARALDCSLDYLCGLYGEREGRPAGAATFEGSAAPEGSGHLEMAPA